MDDLLQEFIAETRETLEALAGEIVMWEADPSDRARLDAIFRFVHTVKGSCGFLDLPRLSRLSHAAEDVLSAVRSGERVPDTALVNAVLAIVDRIGEIIEAIDVGASLDDSGEDLLIAALDKGAEVAATQAPVNIIQRAPTRSVRLSVDLLDMMMSGMSDMVLARNELARRLRDESVDPAIEAALDRLSHTVSEMRDTVTRTRMQKIDALFSALPRMVRDTSAELGKNVMLQIDGSDVELDREMIEMMRDPLVHIIRNAIDHGIESAAERSAAGKRPSGRLTVSARQSGNQIIIEVVDDGRGIDVERLIVKMAASGERSEAELRAMPERAKLDLVFAPGLSSKNEVTAISGRGVGMDVVRANIEQIGGRVELTNLPGRGLCIAIHVPLTLSIISTIVVGAAGQRFAVSRQSIEEIVTVRGDTVRVDMLGDTPVATVRDRRLPLVPLCKVLGLRHQIEAIKMLAIVSVAGGSFALAVDEVLDTEELVIKPAPPTVMTTGLYAGQTLPDSGRPMLLLDCAGIAADAGLHFSREVIAGGDDLDNDDLAVPQLSVLLFLDLDGARRAVPLDIIERVELASSQAVRRSAGQLRLSIDNNIVPLAWIGNADALIASRNEIAVLRMADGRTEIGYAIAEALDIVSLTEAMMPARVAGPIAGVVAIEGEQIEMLDIHWLFATHADQAAATESQPVCLLAGDEAPWMEQFLRPVLETAGYKVVTKVKPGESAAVTLAMENDTAIAHGSAPIVRLRADPKPPSGGEESIYRYDRDGLLAALARRQSGGRGL
ncbi:chemotaxis protein CheA [Sphingomonas sp. 28-63-12]|uniref:chemotaxis protein CheA n=1 Tax=Sphingomonas sp. 28-63-12 TaxID=1970434 RepID=UPI000BDC3BAC|nr:MAG: chemotaxis protein CheA [Sphingomonas sp. 28-63-12]